MMKNNNKGVAMIVAVVMALVFFMLVLTVSLLSTSAYKRAHFYKDRAIALNLAEAGIADALYRMNYKDYGAIPLTNFLPINENFAGGTYDVTYDNVTKELESIGKYKGRSRTVVIKVRNCDSTLNLNDVNNGIAEAFNKHVIYAGVVSGTGTAITGNIARMTIANIASATGNYTVTTVPSTQFEIPAPEEPANLPTEPTGDIDEFQEELVVVVETPVWRYNGIVQAGLPAGVTYDDLTDTWSFGSGYNTRTNRIHVKQSACVLPLHNGHATINGATIQNFFKADGTITVEGDPTFSGADTALYPLSGNITISDTGITITGDLIVEGAALTLDNVTVNGAVLCDNGVTFSGTASTINVPDTSDRKAAIILKSTGAFTAKITTAPTITFDANPTNQKAAIILYSTGGNATLNLQNPITWHSSIPIDRRSAIVYTDSGKAEVTVSNGFDGLLYANGTGGAAGDYGEINLNDGIVNGALVAGGDPGAGNNNVNLTAGTLTWDKRNYTDTSSIFQNFSGGRRVYLLVPGSWKEE